MKFTKIDICFFVMFTFLIIVFTVIGVGHCFNICSYNTDFMAEISKMLLALVSGYLAHRTYIIKIKKNGENYD